ncbi:response regulator [Streptomyces sp. NRRL B-1140]|uniref:response regulator n=1 Tax=Streptomyces sp. NRRL B-1140 TaxID=1415549 RepID=UPI0006B02210|nr:response regulator [Streptomyces sp. NRRL B-1140]
MRVVVVEETRALRDALVRVLTERGIEVVGTAAGHADGLREVARSAPDVVVIDIHQPSGHTDEGVATARAIRAGHPETGLLVLSSRVATDQVHHLAGPRPAGGVGCLPKERLGDPDRLVGILRRVHAGETIIDSFGD